MGEKGWSYREIHTDQFGQLERSEIEAFNRFMLTSEGKPDRVSIELTSVHVLGGNENEKFYVITLGRTLWRLKRHDVDSMHPVWEIDDPHWDRGHSTWLVYFKSNSIQSVRQAKELVYLTSELDRLETCP